MNTMQSIDCNANSIVLKGISGNDQIGNDSDDSSQGTLTGPPDGQLSPGLTLSASLSPGATLPSTLSTSLSASSNGSWTSVCTVEGDLCCRINCDLCDGEHLDAIVGDVGQGQVEGHAGGEGYATCKSVPEIGVQGQSGDAAQDDTKDAATQDASSTASSHSGRGVLSSESSCCRICQEGRAEEALISPCYCSGTVGKLHLSCLETWLQLMHRSSCELCHYEFPVERIPQPIHKFFMNPGSNTEFANLVCDLACFVILTPLLVITMFLCTRGVTYYDSQGKTGSMFAVVTLIASLLVVYLSWAVLAFLYHFRIWRAWRENTAEIRMSFDKYPRSSPSRKRSQAQVVQSLNVSSRPSSSGHVDISSENTSSSQRNDASTAKLIGVGSSAEHKCCSCSHGGHALAAPRAPAEINRVKDALGGIMKSLGYKQRNTNNMQSMTSSPTSGLHLAAVSTPEESPAKANKGKQTFGTVMNALGRKEGKTQMEVELTSMAGKNLDVSKPICVTGFVLGAVSRSSSDTTNACGRVSRSAQVGANSDENGTLHPCAVINVDDDPESHNTTA